jgi:hypothetical protein
MKIYEKEAVSNLGRKTLPEISTGLIQKFGGKKFSCLHYPESGILLWKAEVPQLRSKLLNSSVRQ